MPLLRTLAVLAVALISASSSADDTFERSKTDTGACLSWPEPRFRFYVEDSGSPSIPGDEEFTAIERAFASWNAVAASCTDRSFEYVGKARGLRREFLEDGPNVNAILFHQVYCDDIVPEDDECRRSFSCSGKYDCFEHGEESISVTMETYARHTGQILDADIEINDVRPSKLTTSTGPACTETSDGRCTGFDVQAIVTRELGRAVGLSHLDSETSTMASTSELGDIHSRIIDTGTRAGFCAIYPRGQPATACDGSPATVPLTPTKTSPAATDNIVVEAHGVPGVKPVAAPVPSPASNQANGGVLAATPPPARELQTTGTERSGKTGCTAAGGLSLLTVATVLGATTRRRRRT